MRKIFTLAAVIAAVAVGVVTADVIESLTAPLRLDNSGEKLFADMYARAESVIDKTSHRRSQMLVRVYDPHDPDAYDKPMSRREAEAVVRDIDGAVIIAPDQFGTYVLPDSYVTVVAPPSGVIASRWPQ